MWENAIYKGDAREVLPGLAGELAGQVSLVYMDPPFFTGKKFEGSYEDRYASLEEYLGVMEAVVRAARGLLREDGSLYAHVDYRVSAHMRLLLDDVFGAGNFRNEIIWSYATGGRAKKHFSRKHDTIYFYSKGKECFFDGAAAGVPRAGRNHMKRHVDEQGRAYRSIMSGGKRYSYYDDELVPPTDVWTDIPHLQQRDPERTGYATQKPLALLERIIKASSTPCGIVLDPFCGSGTTLHAASRLDRRFIGVDASPAAIEASAARLNALGIPFRTVK